MASPKETENTFPLEVKPKQPKSGVKKDSPAKRAKSGVQSPPFGKYVDDNILDNILQKLDALQPCLEKVNARLDSMDGKLSKIDARFKEAEHRISELENTTETISILQKKVITLEKMCEISENRSRINNLRVYGLPENTEQGDICTFFAEFLAKLLKLSITLDVQDAHRLGIKSNGSGTNKPRGVILYFLQRRHVSAVMDAVKKMDKIIWMGHQIYINRDLSKTSADNKKSFLGMRPLFKKYNIRYGFIHPSSFKITYNSVTKVYDNIDDLRIFLANIATDEMDTSAPSMSTTVK